MALHFLATNAVARPSTTVPTPPLVASCLPPHGAYPFCDASLPIASRVDDLLKRLTVTELVGQLFMDANLAYGNTTVVNSSRGDLASTGVPRLGIAQFSYMGQGNIYRGASNGCDVNCCTGGKPPCIVDRPLVTVFPQGTGLAATFDVDLAFEMGVVASDESRALQTHVPNRTVEYRSGASSVINIVRDPRWGRVPETYGECPSLTAEIAVAFNRGLLGFGTRDAKAPPATLKTLPVIRHLGAYAGPDKGRFAFDALVTEPDLNRTYLYAWRRLVEADALAGAMSAISALNGVPGIAHASLLTDTLRTKWQFDGFVISDCDTFPSLMEHGWQWAASPAQAAAAALKAGNDINCGPGFAALVNSTRRGYITRTDLERAARRVLTMRARVGDLQPPHTDPWRARAPSLDAVGSGAHAAVAERVVAGGTVLLHHTPGTLPLGPRKRSSAAAETAADPAARGKKRVQSPRRPGGLAAHLEEEDTDRTESLGLPHVQSSLLAQLQRVARARGVPLVVLLVSGGPLAVPELVPPSATAVDALLWVSYYGMTARPLARIVLGGALPSGRLPFTVPRDASSLPPIGDYLMTSPPGRTYRYLNTTAAPPLFPFGFGLFSIGGDGPSTWRLRVCARELVESLGLEHQPLPNTLRLWVGDAATAEAEAEITIDAPDDVACE